jgi:hypothetical protein
MDSPKYLYNERVMMWASYMSDLYSIDDIYELYTEEEEDLIVDDSGEWYNIYASEADD